MSQSVVSELAFYPVKSLGGVTAEALTLDRRGPVGDRRWMIVDGGGRFVTQREHAKLSQVSTQLDGDDYIVRAPGMDDLRLSVADVNPADTRTVRVWSDEVTAADGGERAANWFSQLMGGMPCRVVYMHEDCHRPIDGEYAQHGEEVSFADGYPLLLISASSLEDFNSHLESPIPGSRFRPNVVVNGFDAWAEDDWQGLRIGEVEFYVAKHCARCVVPSIDPATAQLQPEVTKTLFQQRRREDNQFYFGLNIIHRGEGVIRVGDPVQVIA